MMTISMFGCLVQMVTKWLLNVQVPETERPSIAETPEETINGNKQEWPHNTCEGNTVEENENPPELRCQSHARNPQIIFGINFGCGQLV